jgi:hypothetical protein
LNYVIGGHGDSNTLAQLYLVDHLVERATRFTPNKVLGANLVALLMRIDLADVDPNLPRWARRSRAAQAIARHYDTFADAVGASIARIALAWFAKSLRSPRSLAASRTKARPSKNI